MRNWRILWEPMYNTAPHDNTKPARRLYLDYAAGAPVSRVVEAAMERASLQKGNPSALYEEGRAAKSVLEESRARIARVLGAQSREIIFTGSGSESDALAVLGAARANAHLGKHLIVSSIEHKAVLKSAQLLEQDGFAVTYLRPDGEGRIDTESVQRALRADTILVSVMYANNEIGTIEPVADIARAVAAARKGKKTPLYHCDACQAPGQLPLRVEEIGADLLSINAAKAYGPKGIGALYVRGRDRLVPLIPGEQEGGARGGTENVTLAAGFATALEEAEALRGYEAPRLAALRDLLIAQLERRISGLRLHGPRTTRLPNNVHVSIPGVEGEAMLLLLDAAGIAAATGSACNSFDLAPSHVLLAIGEEAGLCHGSIRFSLGRSTTGEDIERAARELQRIVAHLRSLSALTVSPKAYV